MEDVLYRDVDRIVVVGDGKIVADMTPDALLAASVLEQEGIREPLYLTACKYMGIPVTEERKPQHIESFNLSGMEEKAQQWYQKTAWIPRQTDLEKLLEVKNVSFGIRRTAGTPECEFSSEKRRDAEYCRKKRSR